MLSLRVVGVRHVVATGALVVAATLAACGIRTPLTDGVYEVTTLAVDAGTSLTDASPLRDTSVPDTAPAIVDASPDVALPPTDLGNVFLTSGMYLSGTDPTSSARATFFPSVAATGCSVSAIATCTLETCAPPDAAVIPALASAGAIGVSGGLYSLVLAQQPGGQYAPVGGDAGAMQLWHGGESLVVSSTGDAVPAFSATLVAPTQVTMLTPLPTRLSRDGAFPFAWAGESAGNVGMDLSVSAGAASYYLECLYDVGAGTGVIPQEALAALPPGVATFTVSTVNKSDVSVGSWLIVAFAQTDANDLSGLDFTAIVELE